MTDKQIIANLTAKLEAATKPKWVSVHDCVPSLGTQCLVVLDDGHMETGCYEGEVFGFTVDNCPADITHWQPLPPPPEVK